MTDPLPEAVWKLKLMPRPCAVEIHARGYKEKSHNSFRCHGLAPRSFTLDAFGN